MVTTSVRSAGSSSTSSSVGRCGSSGGPAAGSPAAGSTTVNVVPWPTAEATSIQPSAWSTVP